MAVVAEPDSTDPTAILRLLPHGVLVVGADWRVEFANPEAERMIGARGTSLWERCPELEHTAFASAFRYAMADRTELLTESALPTVGWCQARARPAPGGGLLISLRQVHAGTIETGQAKQALLIGEIGDALTREESLERALGRCARAIVRNLDAALARIWIVEDEGGLLELEASAGLELPELDQHQLRLGETKLGAIAEDGVPYLTNDVPSDLHVGASEWARRERLVSFAGYPLRIEDRIVGVLAMYSRRPIDHDVLNSLSPVADALALGIERKRATASLRRAEATLREQASHLEQLHALGKQLAAELDVDALVEKVTATSTRIAGADVGACFYNLAQRPTGQLRYSAHGNLTEAFAPLLPEILALAPGETLRVQDVAGTPYARIPVASFLAIPMFSRAGRPIGALVLGHRRAGAFPRRVEAMIVGVASTATISLDNARLFQEAHDVIALLEKSNRELDQFAYVASHDLKAPLRGIANLAQWVEEDLGDSIRPETRQHLELLRGRVVRLEYLIAGILAYSRATRPTDSDQPVDLGPLVQETWELIAPPATAHLAIAPGLPTLEGSRTQLQQVLLNLLGNAVKYNRDAELHVEVGARRVNGFYEIFVRDDGVGIAPDFHDKIWGLFQTLERRDKVESTGIGLSIVRKIVESRGGKTWVDSQLGRGATFYFTWAAERDGERHGP